ncbi:zinc finger protein 16-like isoform X2 [Polyodon spathula]|uniref:zinc finger protein 16-like isoform X2 n=1 Tax=Polyodon spathula TaxID=7913 RepID=UPI001B7D9330|nr:zinc finger protein 16-like isoform X2 [Polyodon spathula]
MESVHPNPALYPQGVAPIRWVVSENREVRIKEEPVPCWDPPREPVPVPQCGPVYMQQQHSRVQSEQNQARVQQGAAASVPSTYAEETEDHRGSQSPVIKEEASEMECTPRLDPPDPRILRVSRFDLERGSTRFKALRQTPSLGAAVRDTEPVHIKVEVYQPGGEEEERRSDPVHQEEEACALEPGQIKVEDAEMGSVPETRRSVRIGEETTGQAAVSSVDSGQPAALLGIISGQSVHHITFKGQTLVCNADDGLASSHSVGDGRTDLPGSDNRPTAVQNTGSGETDVLGIAGGQPLHNIDKGPTLVHNFDNGHTSVHSMDTATPRQRSSHSNQTVSPLEMSCIREEETVPTDKIVRGDAVVTGLESALNQYRAPGLDAVSLQKDAFNCVSQLASAPVNNEDPQEESVHVEMEVPQAAFVQKDVHANGERQLDSTQTGKGALLVESVHADQEKNPEPKYVPLNKLHDARWDNSLPQVESVHHTAPAPEPAPDRSGDVSAMDTDPAEEKEEEGGEKEGAQISDDTPELRTARSDTRTPDPDETEMEPDLENDDPGPDSVVVDKKVHETGSLHPNEKTSGDMEVPDPKTFDTNAAEKQDPKVLEKREKAAGQDDDDDEPQSLLHNCEDPEVKSAHSGFPEAETEEAAAEVKCTVVESHACPHCPTAFPVSQDLDKHVKDLHSEEDAEKRRTRPVSSRRTPARSRQASQVQNPGPAGTDKTRGKHSCPDCGERFPTPKTLKKHRATHQEALLHPCAECSKTFRDPELLKRHRLVHRETEAAFKDVGLSILEASRWRRKHQCPECGKHFLHTATLKKHRQQQHGGKPRPHPCGECGRCFTDQSHLKLHQKTHSDETPVAFCCSDCGKVFKTKKHLKRHQLVHSGDTPRFPCSECGKRFWDSGHLRRHQRVHTGEMPYPCDGCGKRFRFSGALRKHQRIHTGALPFQCADCGKRFRESSTLKKHELIHSGETPFLCPDCGKMFNQIGNLKKHQQIHAGSSPYQCPECQRCFNRAENLKRHRLIHVAETLHPCPECSASFRSAARLRKHRGEQHSGAQGKRRLRKHQGEQQRLSKHRGEQHSGAQGKRLLRVCEECGKSFKHAGDYHKHCRIHTGEKPYPCTECQKSFNHLGNLKKHLLVHSGETPFECPDCGKKFSQKGNMKKHRRTHNDDQKKRRRKVVKKK